MYRLTLTIYAEVELFLLVKVDFWAGFHVAAASCSFLPGDPTCTIYRIKVRASLVSLPRNMTKENLAAKSHRKCLGNLNSVIFN